MCQHDTVWRGSALLWACPVKPEVCGSGHASGGVSATTAPRRLLPTKHLVPPARPEARQHVALIPSQHVGTACCSPISPSVPHSPVPLICHSQHEAEEASYVHKIQITQWAMAAKKSHPVVCRMGPAIKDFIDREAATGSIEEKHGHDAAILMRTGPGIWSTEVHKYIRQMGSTPDDVTAGAQVEDLVVLPQAAFGCNFRYWWVAPTDGDRRVSYLRGPPAQQPKQGLPVCEWPPALLMWVPHAGAVMCCCGTAHAGTRTTPRRLCITCSTIRKWQTALHWRQSACGEGVRVDRRVVRAVPCVCLMVCVCVFCPTLCVCLLSVCLCMQVEG